MKRSSLRTLLVLALAAGLGACDSAREITAPEAVGPEFAFTVGEAEKVITAGGGFVRLGDHFLFVPRGAVSEPTRFRMETTKSSATTFGIQITAATLGGTSVSQFPVDLTLTLSYSDLDISSTDLWRIDDGVPVKITIWDNTDAKRVWGATDHFTEFLIGDL